MTPLSTYREGWWTPDAMFKSFWLKSWYYYAQCIIDTGFLANSFWTQACVTIKPEFSVQFIIFPGFLLEYGLRVSLRMTLAHSSPPCSQMCRYSCLWTTPPCTSLSLLTWGCPCVAWRFSTNHWPLQHPASWPPQQLFDPNHYYFLFPTVPCPSTSCGTSCVWQVGVQTLVSLSLLRPLHPSIMPLPLPPACEKAVYPSFTFSLSTSAFICMDFSCLSVCPLFLLNGLIWWVEKGDSLWCCFIMLLCYLSIANATS